MEQAIIVQGLTIEQFFSKIEAIVNKSVENKLKEFIKENSKTSF
jgi:hypothetical protein